ncbi:hypothetical protein E2C01_034208 [Portunus trituberculatus]|uniref:Uncharacterized protein n=1 Tax=Portunus trituberculatus TaxID=210409 RepID=A0A5B7F7X5_PORTR|nr:hypothetical protein [Portunus trituberculatus]
MVVVLVCDAHGVNVGVCGGQHEWLSRVQRYCKAVHKAVPVSISSLHPGPKGRKEGCVGCEGVVAWWWFGLPRVTFISQATWGDDTLVILPCASWWTTVAVSPLEPRHHSHRP